MDKVIILFKQYVLKMHKHFGIQTYNLCNMSGYTYDMGMYFREACVTADMTVIHVTIKTLYKKGGRTLP